MSQLGLGLSRRGLRAILVLSATTLTSATRPPSEEGVGYASELRALVMEQGATYLPGCSLKYDSFIPCMWQAVQTGHVTHADALACGEGLRYGFTCGVETTPPRAEWPVGGFAARHGARS